MDEQQSGDMIKAVVDVSRRIIAVGGELHADDEAALLDDGSNQPYIWRKVLPAFLRPVCII